MKRTSPDPAIASGMLPNALAHRFCSQACAHHANQAATARSRRRSSAAEDADIRSRISSCQIASSRSAPIRLRQSSLHGKRDMPRRSHREPRIRSTPIRIPRCIQRARSRPALSSGGRPVQFGTAVCRTRRAFAASWPNSFSSKVSREYARPQWDQRAGIDQARQEEPGSCGTSQDLDSCEGAGPTYGTSPTWRGA